jgi:NifB/MoaA-like Fe-S oxidoreductase
MRVRTSKNNLNLETIRDFAVRRASTRTYFAIGLLLVSLLAAFAITAQANRSVTVWSAGVDLISGDLITEANVQETKVFLPGNSAKYFSADSKLVGQVANRRVLKGELIPVSAVTSNYLGGSSRSVPLKIARNDLPNDLTPGQSVDIYSLPQPDLNSAKNRKSELISEGVLIESIDLKSRDMGGDIGIVIKIPEDEVMYLLSTLNDSRIVVVRNAI